MWSSICEKSVDRRGQTRWRFSEEECAEDRNEYPCSIRHSPEKGLGLFSRGKEGWEAGTPLINETSFVCLPTGQHRARVCMTCLQFGHKKVKVSDDCPDFYFCSLECLHKMDDLTTHCGPIVKEVNCMSVNMTTRK